jgi:hypothetical protein
MGRLGCTRAGPARLSASHGPAPRLANPFRRSPLGWWLCAIGALGLLRFWMRAFPGAGFQADPIAWMWLAGAVVTGAIGIVLVVRSRQATHRP